MYIRTNNVLGNFSTFLSLLYFQIVIPLLLYNLSKNF